MTIRLKPSGIIIGLIMFMPSISHADVSSIISIEDNSCTGTCSVVGTASLEVDDSHLEFEYTQNGVIYISKSCSSCPTLTSTSFSWDYINDRVSSSSWGGSRSVGYDYIQGGTYYVVSHPQYAILDGDYPDPDLNLDGQGSVSVEPCAWGPGGPN